jgi:hypothetical protein
MDEKFDNIPRLVEGDRDRRIGLTGVHRKGHTEYRVRGEDSGRLDRQNEKTRAEAHGKLLTGW